MDGWGRYIVSPTQGLYHVFVVGVLPLALASESSFLIWKYLDGLWQGWYFPPPWPFPATAVVWLGISGWCVGGTLRSP